MARPHLIKDIALQAGVSPATVDRVLNQRSGVRQHTLRRVEQALAELENQSAQVGLAGRKFWLDVVMQAPARFTQVVRTALDREMPTLHPAIFRARYHLDATLPVAELVATLDKIAQRGSHGVLLKAPDLPEVVAAVARLHAQGIPVITLVTDLPTSQRRAYVGMDNRAAGETAAYLLGEWLGAAQMPADAGVLVSLSSNRFRGEEEREIGFRQALRARYPRLGVHEISEGWGLHDATVALVGQQLQQWPGALAVYSIGGANAAILQAFAQAGRRCQAFIAHDLDADNLGLLRARQLSAVLHHDLQHDMRAACLHLLQAHGAAPAQLQITRSSVQVVTPFNLPLTLAG
jgi:LacI family transcriptional regulator